MNEAIFYFFYNLAHKSTVFDWIIIFFAEIFPFIVILLAVIFLLFHHDVFKAENPFQVFLQKKKEIIFTFLSGVLAWIIAHVIKFIIHTDRPLTRLGEIQTLFSKNDAAFPSGHATFFFALGFSIYFVHKKAGLVFILFATLIAISRIIAGVHFPIDILGGFILGALVAYFAKNL